MMHDPIGWDVIISETDGGKASKPPDTLRPWQVDDRDVTEFGTFSLDDDVEVVECIDCHKPVLREAYSFHQENCNMLRDIKAGRISNDCLQNDKLRTSMNGTDVIPDAKDAPDTPRKKKLGGKKNRGPINLDRQCGVINNKGLPCSRSLTCKSHSMGAKRNVAGRSQPYDTLLFEWQKATNPAFVARLEEKERAIAAAKATNSASKDKKRKSNAGADRGKDAETEVDAFGAQNSDNQADMYFAKASYMEVERDLRTALQTIHRSATRERTSIVPMAVRSFAGQYTTRTRRFRALRQLLAQGLSGTAHRTTRSTDSESSK